MLNRFRLCRLRSGHWLPFSLPIQQEYSGGNVVRFTVFLWSIKEGTLGMNCEILQSITWKMAWHLPHLSLPWDQK